MTYQEACSVFPATLIDDCLAISNQSENKQTVVCDGEVFVTSSVGSFVAPCYERVYNKD